MNLTAKAYSDIRENILKGVYKQGQALTECFLSKELDMSRTPIREALKQLELNELIELSPNRCAIVRGINVQDIKDIYDIRSYIEGEAARLVAERITDEEIGSLEEIVDLGDFYFEKKNYEKLVAMDGSFHERLYLLTHSKMMRHILSELHSMIKPYRVRSILSEGRTENTLREHRAILNAVKSRDGELAKKLMIEHVKNSKSNLERILENKSENSQ